MIPPPCCQERAIIKMSYVYSLRSFSTGSFYLGWTTDINSRLQEHNSGKSHYTKLRGPWELIGFETFSDCESAKKRERALKHNPRMLSFFKKRALVSLRMRRLREETTHNEVVG